MTDDPTSRNTRAPKVASPTGGLFPARTDRETIEHGAVFAPRFDSHGLITAIAVDDLTSEILMVAHMNDKALAATLKTGIATYWSRSRDRLWVKGETSGTRQRVVEIRTDCDQDALVLRVLIDGVGVACHNGYKSCFYRVLTLEPDTTPGSPLELDTDMASVPVDELYR